MQPEASTPSIGEQPTEREATTCRIEEQPALELQQVISAAQNSIGPEQPSFGGCSPSQLDYLFRLITRITDLPSPLSSATPPEYIPAFEHPTVTLPAAVVARDEVSQPPVVQVTTPLPQLSTAARPGVRPAAEAAPDQRETGTRCVTLVWPSFTASSPHLSALRRVPFIPVSSNLAAIHQRAFRDLVSIS